MIKREELTNQDSCLNRAKDDEMVFTLLARDVAAPRAIRFWVKERIRLGKNQLSDPQIVEAILCAQRMEQQREYGIEPYIGTAQRLLHASPCLYHARYINGACAACGIKCPNPNCVNGRVGVAGCAICGGVQTVGVSPLQPLAEFVVDTSAPACPNCGAIMRRNGSCYACGICGCTSGCS
jgi:ribosomal protein S27AE